ncbi:MAG: flavodoxin-dependent (E)-4-hydroxy-3-methylbut-2-enyl-diphosphate synthase [Candidatus Melainabacteria bacterium]|nr:flavodoxin-dependent (E)-4-hydroxy-3-methylbut-2-enyl-diphosphate synthase [Candidatus Melainabacteria bacterium]
MTYLVSNPKYKRRKSKRLFVGSVPIGGDAPVVIQSMTTTDTRDAESTLRQINELYDAGCEIVRVAVPDKEAAARLGEIKNKSPIPVISDIHFDWRLALEAIRQGVDALRLNPGNIGEHSRVREVVSAAKERKIPIRIGVNAGSLDAKWGSTYGADRVHEAMVASALEHVKILEDLDFDLIKISLKASDVPVMLEAYRLMAEKVDYPLHLGVTEAGTPKGGTIKSSVGIGTLLAEGLGDTIRVSLTGDPVNEIEVAKGILKSLGLKHEGLNLVSCPSCGRMELNGFEEMAKTIEEKLKKLKKPITVAVMGCVVNGPGESKAADIGIAGGNGKGVIYKKGEVFKVLPEEKLLDTLLEEIDKMVVEA